MELFKKSYDLLIEWMKTYGSLREDRQFQQATHVAYQAEEFSMARKLLDDWKRTARVDPEYYRLRTLVEFRIKAYESALDAMDHIPPDHLKNDLEMIAIRAECRQKLHLPEIAPIPRVKK
jgi:hypothetical protein